MKANNFSGFSTLKDTDREILLKLSDKELIKACSLNKYLLNNVCDDNFFRRKLSLSYPDTLKFKSDSINYKQYYLKIVYYVSKMLEEFNYSYVSRNLGDPQKQYEIFKSINYNNEKVQQLLFKAAKVGELELVKEAVKNGTDIHASHEFALRSATANGHLNVVKYLVSLGADIHINEEGPLRLATERGYLEIVKYLVSLGANIHINDEGPLRLASSNGNLEIVKYFVELGADIHAYSEGALRWASSNGHLEVVKYLVELGADIHAYNDEALRYARHYGHSDVFKYLSSL